MKESKRGKILYAIGVLAFLIAIVSLAFNLLDLVALYKETDGNIFSGDMSLYEMAVDVVFAVLELTLGISLIKQWKTGEQIEIHKTISQLIGAIVYSSFFQLLVITIFSYFTTGKIGEDVGIAYLLVYIVYGLLVGATPSLVKKHKLMELYWVMFFSSVIAVGFCVYEVTLALAESQIVSIATTIANTVLMCLITVFSTSVIVYYLKNPLILERDVKENEDSEVIKTTDKYEIVKIYETRGTDDKVNILITIMTVLSVIFGVAGIVHYAIENNVEQYFSEGLDGIIDNVKNIISSGIIEMFGFFMIFLVLFIYSLLYVSLFTGVFTKQASAKVSVLGATAIGTMISLFTGILTVFDIFMDFAFNRTINLEKYSIYQLIIIGLYVFYVFAKKVYNNISTEINDGIVKRGDSYNSHSKAIARVVFFSGLFSIVCLGVLFAMNYSQGVFSISYLSFAISTLLIMIYTKLEVKHPFSEYTKVKRRIKNTTTNQQRNDEEENSYEI